jgi:Ni/Co efflux regulator RcnB
MSHCNTAQHPGDKKMKKTILTILGSALIVASAAQAASATEHHRAHRAARASAQVSAPVRNANDYVPAQTQNDVSRYQNGWSAPAGR